MGREARIDGLEQTLDEVLGLELSGALERRSYREGGWTAREILAHLADVEFINLWRFCRAVTVDGGPVDPFDENCWARELPYAERPLELSRGLFEAARRTLLHHVASLPVEALDRAGAVHPEKGRLSPREWAELMVGHTRHHLSQLHAIRTGRPWAPVVTPDSWRYTGGSAPRGPAEA